jgi:triacylglycerol lipase
LVFDGIEAVTDLVQKTHTEVAQRWTKRASLIEGVQPIADSVHSIHMASANINYATIRGVSRTVGALLQAATDPFLPDAEERPTPLRLDAAGTLPWVLDHLETSLNGFIGDHLSRRGNALDLGMSLRHDGQAIRPEDLRGRLEQASPKICIFVHGLSATEWSWVLYADRIWGNSSTCYASKLQEDLDYTPLFVRYNSGRHVSENGRALSELIEQVCAHYPVKIEDIALIGHSMGGLVVRSAAHEANANEAMRWRHQLRHVVCIGSPHLGAPLEKGAHILSAILSKIPAAGATVPAAVINTRSDGIKDLRHGYITDKEWQGEDPDALLHDNREDLPMVPGVSYSAIAGTITRDPEHPAGQLFGDLLVRKPSASGEASAPDRHVKFHSRHVFQNMNHLQLANHPAVYEMLRDTLGDCITD